MTEARLELVVRLGDAALILGQRMTELVTLMPELEEELANANFALDYIGQARMFYQYAGELKGGVDEDHFAFRRDAQAFQNPLLLEQPAEDFGDAIVRQFLFETFYLPRLGELANCKDERLASIAARAEKEIRYHLRHARLWLIRLGDGTEESHARVQASLDKLWRYCGEFFTDDDVDTWAANELGISLPSSGRDAWLQEVGDAIREATLATPDVPFISRGGKHGQHSEHLGYLIAEMQHLNRTHPDATW